MFSQHLYDSEEPRLTNRDLHFFNFPKTNENVWRLIVTKFISPIFQHHYTFYFFNHTRKTLSQNKISSKDEVVKVPSGYTLDPEYTLAPWRSSFVGFRRAMQWLRTPEEFIAQYATWVGFDPKPLQKLLDYPLAIVLPIFKNIKIWCHSNFDKLGAPLRFFVDLDSISGIPPMSVRTTGDDPQAWLTQLVPSNYDAVWWEREFFSTFTSMAQSNPRCLLSLSEFTHQRWLWVTNGATKFSKLLLGDEPINTKFGAAVSLSDTELDDIVEQARKGQQPIGVFVKGDEASFKRRLIANVPLGGYIIASYVRYLLESFLGKMPLFEKLSPSFEDQLDVISLLRQGYVSYPLDESAYDYHVTRDSWLGFFQFLHKVFPSNDGVNALEDYFNHAIWKFDGKSGRWLKGMPSGLALTTFLNSWMNYIKQKTIIPSTVHWACGDDVLTFGNMGVQPSLKDIECAYSNFGSLANASKNWSSTHFSEYLKVLYGRYGTSGYPARIFGSLLFTQDLSYRRPDEKLTELIDLWKQLFDRLGLPMDEDMVARDLANAVSHRIKGFNKYLAKRWIHAPKIHGGFGKLPYNDWTFTWITDSPMSRYYNGNRFRLPRVVDYWGPVTLKLGRYTKTNAAYSLGPPAALPPIETPEDWERRLNREDLPDRGPYTSMVLDLIPLPVVDFISVANMSKIATQYSFNVFPNLRGNWNSISSRLINASLGLASFVLKMCSANHLTTYL